MNPGILYLAFKDIMVISFFSGYRFITGYLYILHYQTVIIYIYELINCSTPCLFVID